ncbi:MAG: DUF5916 domain-containing protein, partial [Gammaproteobacteria bacterium]|nr:DUF5916 domain-containing protein [Gammaproteobacteria bacterium]
ANPEEISAKVLRQGGNLFSDDRMTLIIDPFNNKRSGYSFTLNPNGVREEAIYATATRPSDEWDGIWRGASAIVDDGWTMEMAIPFNTVTFDPSKDTWGINFWRRIARKAERMAWESRSGAVDPTVSGEVYGLQGINQGIGLDVTPSASVVRTNDRVTPVTDTEFNPSLDVSYKLTPSINGLVTINTDFAATEVDGRQLDLQRFSLFFPEKRAFFLTDFDIFQFGGVPTGGGGPGNQVLGLRSGTNGLAFFSRRIGLTSDREPVDIIAGAKVSGRMGDVDFGSLYISQDEYVESGGTLIEQSDLLVARVATGVLEESSLGAIVTHGDPRSNVDNSVLGADFQYRNTRLGTNRSAEGRFWLQKSDTEGFDGNDMAWSATVGLPSRLGWEGGIQVHEVQENFNPALGFVNRTGVRMYGGELGYRRNRSGDVFLREVSHGLEVARWEFLDTGMVQSQEIGTDLFSLRSRAGDFGRIDVKFLEEGLLPGEQPLEDIGIFIPSGSHKFERVGGFVRTASHRPFAVQLRVDGGGYYNGDLMHIRPEIEWRPNEHFYLKLEYDYNKYEFPGNQEATTRQISLENELAFNAKLSLVTLVQYDNVSEDVGINSRLRYNLSAGQDIWFVVNHNMIRDVTSDNRFQSTETAAVAKIRYTFRF